MSHTKLYRNFIILQPNETNRKTADGKDLSGYAKVEAKGEKCRVSFYVQNLNPEEKYTMILICSKKDNRNLLSLGSLPIDKNGKGESSSEYFSSSIGGENLSYDKITGAAILKEDGGFANYIMYGFVNGQDVNENWKNFKVIKCYSEHRKSESKESFFYEKPSAIKTQPKEEIKKEEPVRKKENINKEEQKETKIKPNVLDSDKISNEVREEAPKEEIIKKETPKEEQISEKPLETVISTTDTRCKDKKKKDNSVDIEKHIREELSKIEETANISVCVNEKGNFVIYAMVKNKDNGKIKKCVKEISSKEKKMMSKRLNENLNLDLDDFDDYERSIVSPEPEDDERKYDKFNICGKDGNFFESIAELFTKSDCKFKDINYCKWYKVDVNKLEDLYDKNNKDKYVLAYYPMINYYPYIEKYKHFLLGLKCDDDGELKYILYAIPGCKDKSDQPYDGKTGFVTWTENMRNQGYWIMFYDYKTCNIVVPIK
ncbi:hypothetical protein [Clostridium sp. BJN0001]|uniref:hypothetical protein n=1 Tax=Clostridium sp. BJN0001 TaxID=2930219 RepID=UPI001FD5D721|nr:hypothetical protein [Clostridium sp. BJN0001]